MPEATFASPLQAENISVGYGGAPVVKGVSLDVDVASFTVMLGPNGSGKSTVLRALAGLNPVSSGRILLNRQPISCLSSKRLARRIGMLAQNPRAPEGLTVLDLVRQGRYPHRSMFGFWSAEDETACQEALHLTDMLALADQPLDSLSGGQRQRAWIAMALAQQTDILLLDEPTTFLDIAHQIEVLELVGELIRTQGKTVVAVLHDINQAARYADRIVLIKDGGIVAKGKPDDVVTSEVMRAVFGVEVMVMADPIGHMPMCIPLRMQRNRIATE